jgi:hypothetical protein
MTKRLSIAVGPNELRGLALRAGALHWHGCVPLTSVDAADAALRALLSSAPRAFARTRATVVLSPRWVQLKRLDGLPLVRPARLVDQLLRENEQSFFLSRGRPATIVARLDRDGAAWGAAFDTDMLNALVRGARSARVRIVSVAPSLGALAAAFSGQQLTWSDGEQAFEIQGSGDGVAQLRRVLDGRSAASMPMPELLRPLGVEAESFLPALAAATVRRSLPLSWRPCNDSARLLQRRRAVNAAACIALVAAAVSALSARGVHAVLLARDSERELQRLDAERRELAFTQAELRRVDDALGVAARFAAERGRVTRVLAALSEAAPESTAILDLRVDSVEGSFSAIAPHVAELLPAMATVGAIGAPQIVGSVTRETIAGARLERGAFRFRRPRDTRVRPR